MGHIRALLELFEKREKPLAIVEENFFLHDEHIAEAGPVAIEERDGILFIFGMHGTQDVIHPVQILVNEFGRSFPHGFWSAMFFDNLFQIAVPCGDDVISLHGIGNGSVIQSIFSDGIGIDIIIHNLAVRILLIDSI